MSTALSELYMETDMSDNARLFSLTAEVAAYSENGIMPCIEIWLRLAGKWNDRQ